MKLKEGKENFEQIKANTLKKLQSLIDEAKEKGEAYKVENRSPDQSIKCAFVTMRSQEGAARLIRAFDISRIKRLFIA
jgi:predicted peroxiredoxin